MLIEPLYFCQFYYKLLSIRFKVIFERIGRLYFMVFSFNKRKMLISAGITAAIVIAVVFAFDPEEMEWMPKCWFYALTGWKCPSCGFTRALHHALHGEVMLAWSYNRMLPLLMAIGGSILLLLTKPRDSEFQSKLFTILILLYIILYFGWWITRNLTGM